MADEDTPKAKEPPKPVYVGGESLADRILPHLKKIIISIVVIAVVLSGVFGYRAWKHSKQADQTAKIAKVLQLGQRRVAMPGAPEDPNNPTFPDTKARAAALLDEAAKQHADLPPAMKGGLLLDKGDVDAAIAEYRRGIGADGLEGVLAREGLGMALEAKAMAEKDAAARQKLLEEALATYTSMQPKADGPRRAYALYHQGRVLSPLLLNRPAEAKARFEQAKEAAAGSSELAQLIDKRLASLGAS